MLDDIYVDNKTLGNNRVVCENTLIDCERDENFEWKNFDSSEYSACTPLDSSNLNEKVINKRANNLIVFGLELDTQLNDNNYDNPNGDTLKLKTLFLALGIDSNVEIIETRRLECKRNNHKVEPILVRLKDYETKISILKRASDLQNTIEFKHVAISPDYSFKRRIEIKMLIRTRIKLNKQFKDRDWNSDFFSIRHGDLVMITKTYM